MKTFPLPFNFYLLNMYNMYLSLFGEKVHAGVALLYVVVGVALCYFLLCNGKTTEGMSMRLWQPKLLTAPSLPNNGVPFAPGIEWDTKTCCPGPYEVHKAPDPIKLVEDGEMFLFAGTPSSLTCPPTPYSDSMGYKCMSCDQIKYLQTRGGNRTTCGSGF